MKILRIRLGKKCLRIKDCKGLSSTKGLIFDNLKAIDGALIYANEIWMPFCKPLDLYFLDERFRVLEKQKAQTLTFHPKTWKIYRNKKSKYCLEVRQNAVEIKNGQKIIIEK